MTRTASIAIRVEPDIKAAAEKAAADDHRTLASLIEKFLAGVREDVHLHVAAIQIGSELH